MKVGEYFGKAADGNGENERQPVLTLKSKRKNEKETTKMIILTTGENVSICIEHGIDTKKLTEIIIETGTDFRRPKAVGKRDKKGEVKKCTKCRRITVLKGAMFCPYCGADIRSEEQILVTKLEKVIPMLTPLTSSEKYECRNIILEVKKYLESKK